MRPPDPADYASWSQVRARCRNYLQPYEPRWAEAILEPAHFDRRIARQAEEWHRGVAQAFLIFKNDDQLIGGMNINNICRGAAQYASLGYWIDEAEQGKALMSEALQLTISYCFDELRLHRINASTLVHNERSRKLLERGGFFEEGFAKHYLQINGQWQDHILYGLPIELRKKI